VFIVGVLRKTVADSHSDREILRVDAPLVVNCCITMRELENHSGNGLVNLPLRVKSQNFSSLCD